MEKRPIKPLPPVIPALPELVERMRRFSIARYVPFERAKAQTDAALNARNGNEPNKSSSKSGRKLKAA